MATRLLVAIESFAIQTGEHEDGTPIIQIVRADATKVRPNDPIVKGREHLFAPVDPMPEAS